MRPWEVVWMDEIARFRVPEPPRIAIHPDAWEQLYGPRYPVGAPPVTEGPILIENVLAAALRSNP